MFRVFSALLLTALIGASVVTPVARAQDPEPPKPTEKPAEAPAAKSYDSYEALFDEFDKRRNVLITKLERLQAEPNPARDAMQAAEAELIKLDGEYVDALRAYVAGHTGAEDLLPARFELAVTLSRLDDRLAEAVLAAEDFLKSHADSELAADARFIMGQTLFRVAGRENDALAALEGFLEKHPDRQEADAVRMLRIRTLLFMDKVEDAKRSLQTLLKQERVTKDEGAQAFLNDQLAALDWVGRELPAFALTDLAGKAISRDDLKGKPILLFFWDSSSGACLGELPFIQEAIRLYGEKLTVLGISVNESLPALEQYIERNADAIGFRNVWIDRDAENTLVKKLDVGLIPFNVLVRADGSIYRYDVRSDDMLRYAALMTR
jgi:TolA-binding protein